jgi:glucan 1,3-beta-glucosidase
LDLYSYSSTSSPGWTMLGCYTDSVSARSLPFTASVPGGPSAMTVELCESTCLAAGYKLAGVEYADECCKCFFVNKTIMPYLS